MYVDVSERAFEDAIEACLLQQVQGQIGDIRSAYLVTAPGGYNKRLSEDYDPALCLVPQDVLDFVLATQPREWQRLTQHHGEEVKERFLKRLSSEIGNRGALDVLRNGIKDMGCRFRLAYFRPASGLNEETRKMYLGNLFSVVRQLHYSEKNTKSLDLALFLNGIPILTAELKNPLSGQTVQDAIHQYRTDRDPREPLFAYGRCLAHFAVDPDLVFVTTHLARAQTRFLPFNQGKFGGAGNPPRPAAPDRLPRILPLGGSLDARQRAGPGAPVHLRSPGGGRKGKENGQALPDLPPLPAARLCTQTGSRRTRARNGPALPDTTLRGKRQDLHHRMACPPTVHPPRRR